MNNLLTEKAQTCFETGNKLHHQGNIEASIQSYQQAIEIQPDFTLPLFKLAEIYESQKNWLEASKFYQRLIIAEPENYRPYLKFARILQRYNHFLSRSGTLQPGDTIVETNNHKSIVAYQKALELKSTQPAWVYLALGDALHQSRDFAGAIAAYQQAVKVKPDDSKIYLKLAKLMVSKTQLQSAVEFYQKAIACQPQQSARVYTDLGIALSQNQQFSEALVAYCTAVELDPESIAIINHWGGIYKKLYLQQNQIAIAPQDKLEGVAKIYEQEIRLHPEQARGYFGMGHIFLAWQNWNKAIDFFIAALTRSPYWHQIYVSLAYALKQQGNENLNEIELCYQKFIVPQRIIKQVYQFQEQDIVRSATASKATEYIEVQRAEPALNFQVEKTFVIKLNNGKAWRNLVNNDLPNNVIVTAENRLVQEVSTIHNSELIFSASNYNQPLQLDGTIAYLQGIGINNYYHWMLQVIPQLCLLRHVGINLATIDKFAFYRLPTHLPFQYKTLDLLGIPQSKIVETSKHPFLQAKKLIATSPISGSPPRKLACDLLRGEFLSHGASAQKNSSDLLYLSRKNAVYRRILNEDRLISLLESYGFTDYCLESMAFSEQINLFSQAKVIVAPHGAALTNLIFCNPGVKVIEIFAPSYHMTCYEDICNYYNLPYYPLVGEGVENAGGRREYDKDIRVDLDSLVDLMKLADIV